jgi:ubiquinone/menaquinone biosynthesis C-methylase UbiE
MGLASVKEESPSHRDTAEAWDVVSRVKYRAEFQDHLAILRSGGDNLLEPELVILKDLLPGSHVVHVQCSHGFDALGLLNRGAASVLGVDISQEMVMQANAKANALGAASASFLCADAVDLPSDLEGTADLVYTGRGSLPWVLDLPAWARSVYRLLKPEGHVFIFEGHPLAALWEREARDLKLRSGADYFSKRPEENPGFPASVVERELGGERPRMLERQWRPGEVIGVLIEEGVEIRRFQEFPVLFWDQFPAWPKELTARLPNTYAILARKV